MGSPTKEASSLLAGMFPTLVQQRLVPAPSKEPALLLALVQAVGAVEEQPVGIRLGPRHLQGCSSAASAAEVLLEHVLAHSCPDGPLLTRVGNGRAHDQRHVLRLLVVVGRLLVDDRVAHLALRVLVAVPVPATRRRTGGCGRR